MLQSQLLSENRVTSRVPPFGWQTEQSTVQPCPAALRLSGGLRLRGAVDLARPFSAFLALSAPGSTAELQGGHALLKWIRALLHDPLSNTTSQPSARQMLRSPLGLSGCTPYFVPAVPQPFPLYRRTEPAPSVSCCTS